MVRISSVAGSTLVSIPNIKGRKSNRNKEANLTVLGGDIPYFPLCYILEISPLILSFFLGFEELKQTLGT